MRYGSPKLEVAKKGATIKIVYPPSIIEWSKNNKYRMKCEIKMLHIEMFNRGLISNL